MRLSDYGKVWIREQADKKPTSVCAYESRLRSIRRDLGNPDLDDIRERDVITAMRKMAARGLSYRTIAGCRSLLRMVMRDANVDRVTNNRLDFSLVAMPRTRDWGLRTERRPFSREDAACIRALLADVVADHGARERDRHMAAAFLLMLCCGLRRGEALGIRCEDIGGDGVMVRTNYQTRHVEGRNVAWELTPKSPSSIRCVPIVAGDLALLAPALGGEWLVRGHGWNDLRLSQLSVAWWRRFVASAGVERLPPHSLRHTYATRGREAGIDPAVMQRLLGHAHASTTMDTYYHVTGGDLGEAAEAIASASTRRKESD